MANDDDGGSGNFLGIIAHPKVVNPLDAYTDAGRAAAGIWAARRNQADQLAGQASQGAIDPATGEYSATQYGQNLKAAGPAAALSARVGLESNQSLSDAILKQNEAKLRFINSQAGALAIKDNITDDDILASLQQGVAGGLLTQAEVQRQLSTVPPDQAGRRQWAEQHRDSTLAPLAQVEQRYGTRPQVTSPQGTSFPPVPPARQGGAGPFVPAGQSQQELNTLVKIGTDANGKDIMGTQQQGQNLAAGRGMNDNGPAAGSPLGTGRLPPALTNPNKPAAASPATAPGIEPVPGGGFKVGQPPADRTAQEASATAGTAAFQKISEQGVAAKSRGAVLDNMLADTTQFTSGPLTAQIAKAKAYAQRLGIPVNTEGLTAVESIQKLAAQLNTSQGSDARLAVSEASNPHADLSPGGLDLMIRQLRGNEDYNLARARLAEAHPDQKDSRGFEARVGTNLDPRVFQYERMKPEQKATYFKALGDKDAFIKAHDWAAGQKLFGG